MRLIEELIYYQKMTYQLTELILSDTGVQKLLHSNQKFDLVIHDPLENEAFHGFANYYKAPSIVISSHGVSHWSNSKMGNPYNPAYMPDFRSTYSKEMNFIQRTVNTFKYIIMETFLNLYVLPKQNELLQKYFPGSPHVNELNYNTSLMLLNSHSSTQAPSHLLPNMIEIGGYHVKPTKPLPTDLQEYLEASKDGVVYFNMGSILRSKDMPIEIRNEILAIFGKLKQNILWKWEDDDLPGIPSNVKLAKWLPQQDILAHPNVKLFVTHGGMLSITEAIYHGVPILGLPVCRDQERNVMTVQKGGYGLSVPFETANAATLASAFDEILNNPKSSIIRDQPQKPLERAIYWIEYVMRHQGAPHLRTAALDLYWYQLLLLDVALVVVLCMVAVLCILWKILKLLCIKKDHVMTKEKKCN